MNGLDLFSGIGGITKALEGYVDPVAYCERDRYAVGVLLSRMHSGDLPTAPIWDDVLTLHGAMLPHVDIIYGGFPCQDISVAGRGEGLDGQRSGLFRQIIRLTSELRPTFLFLENVPVIRTRGAHIVVGELARLGYDCRWNLLSAASVGANHKRERWFLLAHARRVECQARTQEPGVFRALHENGTVHDNPHRSGEDVADALANSKCQGRRRQREAIASETISGGAPTVAERSSWWATEPNVGRVAYGIPDRVHRLRALGNAVVPAQAREAFERLMGLNEQ